MAIFLLIRHGNTDMVGRVLTGRTPGIHLNEEGRAQAESLALRLAGIPLTCICSSPLTRTRETAAPIAQRKGLTVEIHEGLTEIDTGEWTGTPISDMSGSPEWEHFNFFRTGTRIPGGETILEIQKRMVDEVENLRRRNPEGVFALVSHADPIKTVLAYYLGLPLDFWSRIAISPASVSVLSVNDYGPSVHCLNHTGELAL